MAPVKTIQAALVVVFLCFCSQALATNGFDYYILVLMWPGSYCKQSSNKGCCLPTTGKPALDFFVTGLQTYNSATGNAVTKCDNSNFDIDELADLKEELHEYWSNIKCPSTNPSSIWKNSWKTYGVCTGLSEHDYFLKALELRQKVDLLNVFENNGIEPTTKRMYNLENIKSAIQSNLGAVSFSIQCTKNKWNEWQFYQIYICFDKESSNVISCPNEKSFTCGNEVTFSPFTYDMLVDTAQTQPTIRMYPN